MFNRLRPRRSSPPPLRFSQWSSPAIRSSGYACEDFMVGVGMVIIQPSTNKVVVVYDTKKKYVFLPRGRKDSGETLQEAAVREAYEESGYQVSFLPLYKYTHQPPPPADPLAVTRPDIEPFYMTVMTWEPRVRNGKVVDSGGEYFISWFMGQIEEDAIHHENTGMPDEQNYKSYIVTFEEALACLPKPEANVVMYAQHVWTAHLEYLREREMKLSDPSHMLNAGLEASMGNVSLGD